MKRRSIKSFKKDFKRDKRGDSYFAFFFALIVLVGVGFGLLVLNKVWSEVQPQLAHSLASAHNSSGTDAYGNPNVNLTKVLEQTGSATTLFDNLLPFLIIGLFAFILMGAGAILRHPIMVFVGLIILAVVVLIAVVYANVYKTISQTPEFAPTASKLAIQTTIFNHFPTIIFIMSLGVIVFLLWRGTSGGSSL